MTKKDYELFASIIKKMPTRDLTDETRKLTVIDVACKAFSMDNDRFDEKKFKEACGVTMSGMTIK